MLIRPIVVASIALGVSASPAFAQATVDPNARASDDGRPAPAAERIEPDLGGLKAE